MNSLSKSLAVCLLLIPGYLLAQKDKEVLISCLATTPPVIDAQVTEWTDDWVEDPKGHFFLNVCNDPDNLYLRIKIADVYTQQKVALFGLSVLLSAEGKKGGPVGVMYPIVRDLSEDKNKKEAPPKNRAEYIQMKNALVADAEALELIGLAKENISSSRTGLMNGIEVIIRGDSTGEYIYEAKIPFKAFKLKKTAIKTLGLTLRTGKYHPPARAAATPGIPGPGGLNPGQYMRYGRAQSMYGSGGGGRYGQFDEMTVITQMFVAVKLQ